MTNFRKRCALVLGSAARCGGGIAMAAVLVSCGGSGETAPTASALTETSTPSDRSTLAGTQKTIAAEAAQIPDDNFPADCAGLPARWYQPPSATAGWSTTGSNPRAGGCSLSPVQVGGTSQISVTGTFTGGYVIFHRTHTGTGCFTFYIDSIPQFIGGNGTPCGGGDNLGKAGPTTVWDQVGVSIGSGVKTLTWSYVGNGSDSGTMWIDGVRFPSAVPEVPASVTSRAGVHAKSLVFSFESVTPMGGASPNRLYVVRCSNGSVASAESSPILVYGVSGTTYCSVAAYNDDSGVGSYSPEVTSTASATDRLGDFSLDGKPDILFQNVVTGDRYIWVMQGSGRLSDVNLGNVPVSWQMAGTGDFNGDGKPDILWQNTATGDRYVWFMNGGAFQSDAFLFNLPVEWSVATTGDFNGDGWTDIVWQNTSTGARYIWFMKGTTYLGDSYLGYLPPEWSIAAAADFNADGKADLVLQNTATGLRWVWFLDQGKYASGTGLGTVGTDWSIATVGDFNDDGKPDLVWQNTSTGGRYVWFMNGASYAGEANLGTVPTAWSIVQ